MGFWVVLLAVLSSNHVLLDKIIRQGALAMGFLIMLHYTLLLFFTLTLVSVAQLCNICETIACSCDIEDLRCNCPVQLLIYRFLNLTFLLYV